MTTATEPATSPTEPAHSAIGVITAWSAVSAFGIGANSARTGLISAAEPAAEPCEVDDWQVIGVPDFNIRNELGTKGTRSLDRLTGLTVTAVRELLDELGGRDSVCPQDDIGLVLGTDTGSIKSMMDFTRDSLTGDKPYHVDPSRFPNAVMNCAAGRSAIWYSLRGPNATVSSGRVAGLAALRYGSRILRGGQADAVICGAVEEYTLNRAWLERHIRGPQTDPVVLGEGCAVFLVESASAAAARNRKPVAEILSTAFRVCAPTDDPVELMSACITAALRDAALSPGELAAVAGAGDVDGVESAALAKCGVAPETVVNVAEQIGDVGAASASFAIAATIVALQARNHGSAPAIIIAYDRDGGMGAMVLRVAETTATEVTR